LCSKSRAWRARLSGNRISGEGTATLASWLRSAPSLRELHVDGNPALGPDGARALATVLPSTGLRELMMAGCGGGGEAAEALAAVLPATRVLQRLSIANNAIPVSCKHHPF
jgi:hypothetical protein